MAKVNELNPQEYQEYILEVRPDKKWSDEELEKLAPWNEEIQKMSELKMMSFREQK